MSPPGAAGGDACAECLRRAWLIGRLAGHLDQARDRALELLELGDRELIAALGGRHAADLHVAYARVDPADVRAAAGAVPAVTICRHAPGYPRALADLPAPPRVLFLRGEGSLLGAPGAVAIVGARRASPGGVAHARELAARLAVAGLPVISGLALGIDGAAHAGALDAGGATLAVLPAGPERPYPASHRALHRRIVRGGLAISELPPGSQVRRWSFPARNRIIAALARGVVVVEAGEHSGALVTARLAGELGRPVAAVPGRIGAAGSAGPHRLIRDGATLVTTAEDVLELLGRPMADDAPGSRRPDPPRELRPVLELVATGSDTPGALAAAGVAPERAVAALAALELAGYLRREPGGRYAVRP